MAAQISTVSRLATTAAEAAAIERALERASIATAASIYVVDDHDAANIQFVLAALKLRPDIGITMALSNERLVPHTAEELRQRLNIHYAISTSAIAARAMLEHGARQASSAVISRANA